MSDPTYDPEQPQVSQAEADLFREPGTTDRLTEDEIALIASHLGSLALDSDTVLGEHQQDAFEDIVQFYKDGGRECYVQLPTGTGKTVLFVELSKKLIEASKEAGEPQRIIVLAPTVDLVYQTVGGVDEKTGKKRGFKGFAPELEVRAVNGRMTPRKRIDNISQAEVLVTTYDTFRNLISGFVDGEHLSKEDVLAQVAAYELEVEDCKVRIRELNDKLQHHIFSAYFAQEVEHVRDGAEAFLNGPKVKAIPEASKFGLTRICEIADTEQSSFRKIQEIKTICAQLPGGNIRKAANWMNSRRREHRKAFRDSKQPEVDFVDIPLETLETEASIMFGLNPAEGYMALFLLRHRFQHRPGIASLVPGEAKEKAKDIVDEIGYVRDSRAYAKGKARAIAMRYANNEAVAKFGLVICDEAHRAIGSETWQSIRDFAERKDVAVIGLTATDEYYNRSLADYFEQKVHELTKQEAMRRKIVNPIAMFVHETGLRFQGVSLDVNGDYDRTTIRQMRFSEERNRIGVNYARMLSEMGYSGIMPAIPGDETAHAKVLAEMINQTTMIDPVTGEERLMRARYVVGDPNSELRKRYYQEFEAGQIDWLTFVDVIREGWDSDKAKAIINMRPTRSPLLAIQRVGRIGRTHPGAPVSVAIDLFDGIELEEGNMELPPVLVPDVFNMDGIEQGAIAGGVDVSMLDRDFERLRQAMPTQTITAYHSRYVDMIKNAQIIDARGIAKNESGTQKYEWQTFEAIQLGFNGYLPKEIILDAIEGDKPLVRVINGRSGGNIVPLFNVNDVLELHTSAPEINPWKLFKDTEGTDWISPEGCTVLLSKRFPHISAADISDVIRMIEAEQDQKFEKQVARFRVNFHNKTVGRLGFTHLFRLEEVMDRLLPYLKELASLQS